MTTEQIQIIVDSIKSNVPEMKTAVFLAKIDDDGRVLKRDFTQNEYSFAGIHDRDDGYFYIRLRNDGKIQFSETSTTKKFASMQNFYKMRFHLRIVACLRNVDPICFEEKIRFAIMNADLISNSSFANVVIEPVESTIDPVTVVFDESPKGVVKPFDKNLTFIAFDFDLVGDRDMSLEFYCLNPCSTPSC